MRIELKRVLAASAWLMLVACGGGGSSSGSSPPDIPQFAVNAAQRHLLSDAGSWTLAGSANGQAFTIDLTHEALPVGVFAVSGATATRSRQTVTLMQAGVVTDTNAVTYYFNGADVLLLGSDNGDTTCSVATASTAVPVTAVVGDTGPLYADNDLTRCSNGAAVAGTTLTTWSLESDSGVVLLCWNQTAKDVAGTVLATLSTCIETSTAGILGSKARVTIAASGFPVVIARNF